MTAVIPTLLLIATLLPFFSFWVILFTGPKLGKAASSVAISAILGAALLSYVSMGIWLREHWPASGHHGEEHAAANISGETKSHFISFVNADPHSEKTGGHHGDDHAHGHEPVVPPAISGVFYTLAKFGKLSLDFSYYVDSLTLCMFCMVTLIASCIHFFASGYMHDEESDVHDHEVTLADGSTLVRPGRYFRFFQYLSLFCFSMLGLVLAGNIALVFVFWELVGICSYFLIGFYIERKSASNAANKAFITNRVGDFGMIIGLMALWSSLGTFSFGDQQGSPGLFSKLRSPENHFALRLPDSMIEASAKKEIAKLSQDANNRSSPEVFQQAVAAKVGELRKAADEGNDPHYGYWLLVIAGVGIFCGCVGKSAQFPLHVWLPDAMEGPTPVSALVHSATMVAAGVYLVGRFYPVFVPEVLLVIALTGTITLFMAATIAITAVDIKRVLAYSTVSQLGYMMLSLGVGGWRAGLMHLITHAFFKSLMFLCSGSVIHAVHTNDMRQMGGLWRKMPITAITMLIGCLAIAGVGLPFVIGFSGYYSKDAILEQAYSLYLTNGSAWLGIFIVAAAGGAAITAFYMFRMWYLTFAGSPRDDDRYEHAHESPAVMFVPLVILSVFAIGVAWETSMLGYALIPAGFLIVAGLQRGWFKLAPASHHVHDSHGHNGHDHDSHDKHDDHGHALAHAKHEHDAHGHSHSHVDDHGHDSKPLGLGWLALILISTIIGGGLLSQIIPNSSLSLANLLEQARPAGTAADMPAVWFKATWPNEHTAHLPENFGKIVQPVTLLATGTWLFGIGLATLMYGVGYLKADEVRRQFDWIYRFLWGKWFFDELYSAIFIQPAHVIARFVAYFDRSWIDGLLHLIARVTVAFSTLWERVADRTIVDGAANLIADRFYSFGLGLKRVQTGRLRQYVMFIVVGSLAVFTLVGFFWNTAAAR